MLKRGVLVVIAMISGAVCLAVAVLLTFTQIHPYRPRTPAGWLLLLFGTPLVLGALALIGAWVEREPLGRCIVTHTEQTKVAWLGSAYLAIRTLLIIGLAGLAAWLVVSHTPALQLFLLRHFALDGP